MSKYTSEDLVAYCGINCKECRMINNQRVKLAIKFKESLDELPLEMFKKQIPQYKNVDEVLEFLTFFKLMGGSQTCCTDNKEPCGNPMCQIRICVKEKGIRTCAECKDYKTCSKLDFLKPTHKTLIEDLDIIKIKGLDYYIEEKVKKFELKPLIID